MNRKKEKISAQRLWGSVSLLAFFASDLVPNGEMVRPLTASEKKKAGLILDTVDEVFATSKGSKGRRFGPLTVAIVGLYKDIKASKREPSELLTEVRTVFENEYGPKLPGRKPLDIFVLSSSEIGRLGGPVIAAEQKLHEYFGNDPNTFANHRKKYLQYEGQYNESVGSLNTVDEVMLTNLLPFLTDIPEGEIRFLSRLLAEYGKACKKGEAENVITFISEVIAEMAINKECRDYFLSDYEAPKELDY